MAFQYIKKSNNLYASKNALKNRDLSILEFQMRILDIARLPQTPLLEKAKFLKIIDSNLQEFISIRLPDADDSVKESLIHTIEVIYRKLGDDLISIKRKLPRAVPLCVKRNHLIPLTNFEYIYSGEDSVHTIQEMIDVIQIKKKIRVYSMLYNGSLENQPIENGIIIDSSIQVPHVLFQVDDIITILKEMSVSDSSLAYQQCLSQIRKMNYYEHLKKEDLFIRTPYESYETILDFIHQMCIHPKIQKIFITLYRTAEDSKIIESLILARKSGKEVYAYLEPTARGNEEDNIKKFILLKNYGIHVCCTYFNYKVHGKIFCAIDDQMTIYSHVGTGNYNEKTAEQYTDFHLLTTNPRITYGLINIVTSIFRQIPMSPAILQASSIYTSPIDFRRKINSLILEEMEKGKDGRIWIKCNSLCDCAIIDKLYQAADHGVDVRIICRTGCSIRPHPGIIVKSKVGRYLEHDRFYIFGNQCFISSADLLLRNINKRVEILCQLQTDEERRRVMVEFDRLWIDEYIHVMGLDGSWHLQKNGL